MKNFAALLLTLVLPASLLAQTQSTGQAREMKQLAFLVGQWKGEGWIEFARGQRRAFTETENVQTKLGGEVLLIEGLGKTRTGGGDQEVTIHNAIALVSYDATARAFRFEAHQAGGRSVNAEAKVAPGLLEWGFQQGGTNIRFTITLSDKGEWFEVGEVTEDGKAWRKFFEMTLQRVKSSQ